MHMASLINLKISTPWHDILWNYVYQGTLGQNDENFVNIN